jgi:hypothetical protein
MNAVKTAILLVHAFVGWALCDATMGIGMATTSLNNALIVHAIAAPIFFACISLVYFRYFNYTSPLRTALVFLALVIAMDFFVVAMLINRSFEMFTSPLGTWIPFVTIFAATYLTGSLIRSSKKPSLGSGNR